MTKENTENQAPKISARPAESEGILGAKKYRKASEGPFASYPPSPSELID